MKRLLTRQNGIAVASVAGVVVALGFLVIFGTTPTYGAREFRIPEPLQLTSVSVPIETLSASTPSNIFYTVTSSDGPFCLEGFVISASTSGALPTGNVTMGLANIDGFGLSYQSFTLFDGASGGFSPLDLVLSYGNHICASGSLIFQATEFPGSGPGASVDLFGQAMVLAKPSNAITITGSANPPQIRRPDR
jgi:hypothetical protein